LPPFYADVINPVRKFINPVRKWRHKSGEEIHTVTPVIKWRHKNMTS
jgi:hypothetical protein